MDPALAILDRALKGDVGALSFLERTASIYVYDGTNPGQPKICGAWDFLSQALTEVERYETRVTTSPSNLPPCQIISLDGHVQLLATMSRRAARRSPQADQKLVEICLTNAAYHGSAEQAHHLINANRHMREREMGRLAAMVFDFSYHNQERNMHNNNISGSYQSAFSNPITMESLCAIVAANAISNGPHDFVNLVSSWIVPSIDNLPPYAVASVTCHLAAEAAGKNAPVGIGNALKTQLFDAVVSKVLAPMLQEAVRESDHNDEKIGGAGGRLKNQRIASMVFKALERWSSAACCSLVQINQVCKNTNVNIIEIISDSMYSDSEMVMDALAEFLDTLLRKQVEDDTKLEVLAIAGSNGIGLSSHLNQCMSAGILERQNILLELISAVGLQRLRVNGRVANGDTGVCRCLASIARSITVAAQSEIKTGKFAGGEEGFIELLVKLVRHSSIHVCGIALEALLLLITPRSNLSIKLLPILQGKAIVPPSLVGLILQDDCDVDYNEFERFREHLLTEVLIACYRSNRAYYIESCTCAIEEFCSPKFKPNPQTAYQLEAALFCLSAVSLDASKRALLLGKSPAVHEAAAKACKSQSQESMLAKDIPEDAKKHNEKLGRTILVLSNAPQTAVSNPLFLAQMCRFIGKYAKWISESPTDELLNCAATLTLQSFDQAVLACKNGAELLSELSISPLTYATTALRNLLSRSPHRFTSLEALSTLEKGWKMMYDSSNVNSGVIDIEDKKALCSGVTRVISVLSEEKWQESLLSLTNEPIALIDTLTKTADQLSTSDSDSNVISALLEKIANEILVLSIIIQTFNNATKKHVGDAPALSILQKVWPFVNLLASTQNGNQFLFPCLSELLLVAVSMSGETNNINLIQNIDEVISKMMESVSKSNETKALHAVMELVSGTIESLGQLADNDAKNQGNEVMSKETHKMREIVEQLISRSLNLFQALNDDTKVDLLPKIFSICTSSIQRCPVLFTAIELQTTNVNSEKILIHTITLAVTSVDQKHTDVARAALLYLKEILFVCSQQNANCENTSKNLHYILQCKSGLAPLLEDLIMRIIHGACGHFPREVLDPAASVLNLILKEMVATEAERVVKFATSQSYFRLGNEATQIFIAILGKCVQSSSSVSMMMDLFEDTWTIHQTYSSNESIVDGDHVKKFIEKYRCRASN